MFLNCFIPVSDHHFLVHQLQNKARAQAEDAEGHEQANEEIDAVEAFRVCHTNRNNVIADAARESLVSPCTCLFQCLFVTSLLVTVVLQFRPLDF